MDVYLIPLGPNRYEMYCEEEDDDPVDAGEIQPGRWYSGLVQKFRTALARVEAERLSGGTPPDTAPKTWFERVKDRGLCWIAEKIAEQRLLWGLRKQTQVNLFFPDDVDAEAAQRICRADLQRESERHLKWLIIDTTLTILSGALFWLPGPNALAYYFGFRMVGHYLSRRGAKHALTEVQWQPCANPELSRLRQAIALRGHERDRAVHDVASRLNLEHLAKFVERVAIEPA